MSAILIPSLTEKEASAVKELLIKNNITSSILSDEQLEELEDYALLKMMEDTNTQDLVLRESIMQKLNG